MNVGRISSSYCPGVTPRGSWQCARVTGLWGGGYMPLDWVYHTTISIATKEI